MSRVTTLAIHPIDAPVVSIVDDDVQVLRAYSRLLREHGLTTATFESAEAFLAQYDPSRPGCLVLDVNLPGLTGLALQRRLVEVGPLPIVFLTGHGDIPTSVRAMKAGAQDFLIKPVAGEVLIGAVRAALAQDERDRKGTDRDASLRQRLAGLSTREREVLQRLAAGKLNKQIAGELGIAEATVKFHRSRLMERMQAHTVAELMHFAARLELHAPADDAHRGPGNGPAGLSRPSTPL
jgi:FixJ family two-component response regulator